MSPKEKELTAYHEGGHAVVAFFHPNCDPLHKITIVSRGMAGGYTMTLPDEDRSYQTRSFFEAQLAMALGGHVAEELVFGEMSTGPGNDIQKVTQMARAMVTRYGMSEKLGPRTFGRKEELVFLGREISEQRDYSEKVAEEIDEEVHRIVNEAHEEAKRILNAHRAKLDHLAKRLLEVETMEGENLRKFMQSDPNEEPPVESSPAALPPAPTDTGMPQDDGAARPAPRPGLAWGGGPAT
jgi:cell division protease FtsH